MSARTPLVAELAQGRTRVWVQDGHGWIADRLPGQDAFTPWRPLDDEAAPDIGGRVLTQAEVAQLVPPPIPKETTT